MNYFGDDDVTQMMGIGYLGEVRSGPDGNLYQWVEGIDGLGNSIGFWKKLARKVKNVARKALPIVTQLAPAIPFVGPAVAAGLKTATPFLKRVGVAGYDGLGALYQAPDGTLYQQVHGLAQEEDLQGFADDDPTQMMGIGYLGEVRSGPDGNLYQWVQGVDGLGNPVGFWKKLRRKVKGLMKKALPIAQQFAPLVPGVGPTIAAGLTKVTPILKQAGIAGYEGLGALYQAPDGTLYQQVHGLAQEEDLQGFADDDDVLEGFADADDFEGFADEDAIEGLEGYVRQDGMSGVDAFVPQESPQTRWFTPPNQTPEMWKSPW